MIQTVQLVMENSQLTYVACAYKWHDLQVDNSNNLMQYILHGCDAFEA